MQTEPSKRIMDTIKQIYDEQGKLKEIPFDKFKIIVLTDVITDLTDDEFEDFISGLYISLNIKSNLGASE